MKEGLEEKIGEYIDGDEDAIEIVDKIQVLTYLHTCVLTCLRTYTLAYLRTYILAY